MTYLGLDTINSNMLYAPIDYEYEFSQRIIKEALHIIKKLDCGASWKAQAHRADYTEMFLLNDVVDGDINDALKYGGLSLSTGSYDNDEVVEWDTCSRCESIPRKKGSKYLIREKWKDILIGLIEKDYDLIEGMTTNHKWNKRWY